MWSGSSFRAATARAGLATVSCSPGQREMQAAPCAARPSQSLSQVTGCWLWRLNAPGAINGKEGSNAVMQACKFACSAQQDSQLVMCQWDNSSYLKLGFCMIKWGCSAE
jgi:hypothetical protein